MKTVDCYKQHFLNSDIYDNAAIIAIWFHDSIYIPGTKTGVNERASSIFMSSLLMHWTDIDTRHDMQDYILATEILNKFGLGQYTVERQVRDCDIYGLSLPQNEYIENSKNIRREYECTNEEWYTGRSKFLQNMLNRKTIYATPEFQQYEGAARNNLQAELEYIKLRTRL